MSTEAEKKMHEEEIKKTDKTQQWISDTQKETSAAAYSALRDAEKLNKWYEDKYGKDPTKEAILAELKNSDTFKDVESYEEAMDILKNWKLDKETGATVGKWEDLHFWLTRNVKEKKEQPKEEKESKVEKVDDVIENKKESENKTDKEDVKEEDKDETKESKPEKKEKTKKEKKQWKWFFGKVGSVVARPFKTAWKAIKWTGKTAWRWTKLVWNSSLALTKSALKTVRAPVSRPSHILWYKSISKWTKAWAEDYKKYRTFKK